MYAYLQHNLSQSCSGRTKKIRWCDGNTLIKSAFCPTHPHLGFFVGRPPHRCLGGRPSSCLPIPFAANSVTDSLPFLAKQELSNFPICLSWAPLTIRGESSKQCLCATQAVQSFVGARCVTDENPKMANFSAWPRGGPGGFPPGIFFRSEWTKDNEFNLPLIKYPI